MNSIVGSLLNFLITSPKSMEELQDSNMTHNSKQLPLLKTQQIEHTIGNHSKKNNSINQTPQQSSTSPRNNLQLVSSISCVSTTCDHLLHPSESVPILWKNCKVDTAFLLSKNSMQPNRDITSFMLKNRKQYEKTNFYNNPSVNRKQDGSPSLTVNTFHVVEDNSLIVRSMKTLSCESICQIGCNNINWSSYSIKMKNEESDSSNFHLYSSLPISTMYHACYYEITLIEMSIQNPPTLCIGYGRMDNDLHNHVGWFCESVALHTDDQRLRNSQQNSMYRVGGPHFTRGDTIGVYWDLNSSEMIYFTKNGEFIDYKTKCRIINSNDFLIALSGQVHGNSTLTFKLNVGNERFQCKHFNDLYHLSESQTKLSRIIDSEKFSDIFIRTSQ